jgi:hypothetical protein
MTVHIQRLESRITVYVYASHPLAVVCAGGGGDERGGVIVNTSKLQCVFIIFPFLNTLVIIKECLINLKFFRKCLFWEKCTQLFYLFSSCTVNNSQKKFISTIKNSLLRDTIPKIWDKYSQKRNSAASVLNSTFMCLWAIYILLRLVYLFCCRKICGLILEIYKSLTDT